MPHANRVVDEKGSFEKAKGPRAVDAIEFNLHDRGDVLVVTVKSQSLLDVAKCTVFTDSIRDAAVATSKLVIHFGSVQFLGVHMLGELYRLNSHCLSRGTSLALCCFNHQVGEVFKIIGADKTLKIYDTLDSALENKVEL